MGIKWIININKMSYPQVNNIMLITLCKLVDKY